MKTIALGKNEDKKCFAIVKLDLDDLRRLGALEYRYDYEFVDDPAKLLTELLDEKCRAVMKAVNLTGPTRILADAEARLRKWLEAAMETVKYSVGEPSNAATATSTPAGGAK